MRKMRGFSKTLAVVLCVTLLLSGIVLPQGVVASDVTTGLDKVYPDNLLTESVFSEYFTAASGDCSFSVSNNDEYLMEISKGAVIPSKSAIEADRYVISFDALLPENGSDVGIRFKANAAGTSAFRGLRILNTGWGSVAVYSKTPTTQGGLGDNATPRPTAGDWTHVELVVTETDVTVTLTSGTTGNSYTYTAWAYNAAGDTLSNYIAFYQEGSGTTVKNFQVYTIPEPVADVEGTVYPKNLLASKYVFNEYFIDKNSTCTFTEESGEYVMKVQPGTSCVDGSGIVSKTPIDAKEYIISFDAKFSASDVGCGGPVFLYKTNAGTDEFMGTFWNATSATAMNVHHKVSVASDASVSQPEAKYYQSRPSTEWMHVVYEVTETAVSCTFTSGAATSTYTVAYADKGFSDGLEGYVAFLTQNAGDYYYIKNFQIITETAAEEADGLYPSNLFADSKIYGEYFNDTNAKGTLAVADEAYVLQVVQGAVIPTQAEITADKYTISFDALLPGNGSDVGIRFKADAAGTAAFRGLRILNTTWGSVAVYSKTLTAQTSLGDNATPRPTAGDWMHVVIAVDATNVTVTLTSGTTGKSHTYNVWEYNTAGDTLGQYIAIYQEGSDTTIKDFQIVTAQTVSDQEIPVKDGYLFSGYYADAALSEQYTEITGTAYRKFVDANVLSVKAQKSDGDTAGRKDVRFVTSVDSLNYGKVGFEITVGNKTITKETTTVYEPLQAGTAQVDPSTFSSQSQYMAAYSLWDIPESAFDTDIKVRAYWVTPDGLIVHGAYRTVTVNGLA